MHVLAVELRPKPAKHLLQIPVAAAQEPETSAQLDVQGAQESSPRENLKLGAQFIH